jgi:hypothetical protein
MKKLFFPMAVAAWMQELDRSSGRSNRYSLPLF